MLTGDLLQFTRRSGRVHPRRVDPSDARLLEAVNGLAGLFQAHIGQRRGDLEEAIGRYVPPGLDPKRVRGLARLLWERCEFQTTAEADPPALREALFGAAAEEWKRFSEAGTAAWRAALVERIGQTQHLTPPEVDAALYADLEENQIVTTFESLTPGRLLERYNVAQIQGLLLKADRVRVTAPWPTPQRLRQLLRYLKFFGLLFVAEAHGEGEGKSLTLTVDGPLSVLESATRYGLNLAQFLPALLLWEGPWKLTAEVRLRGRAGIDQLDVEPHPALRSHYPDRGQWVPDDVRRFVEAFNATPGPWRAEPAEEVSVLPGNAFLVPDFRFVQPGRVLLLEHILYPSPERIAALLERTEGAKSPGYAIAARQFAGAPTSPRLFTYRRTLTPAAVREWLDQMPFA
jgi:hypothetical protein